MQLTDRDKRTLRIAAVVIAVYLALFYGLGLVKKLELKRSAYQQLVRDATALEEEIRPYENRVLLLEKLRERFQIDFSQTNRSSLVGEASAAIQNAAKSSGIKLGPIRESPGSASSRELASMQLEGVGPVDAVIQLLWHVQTLGFPLMIDSVQVHPEPTKPGSVKLTLQLVLLNFEQWKEKRRNV